MVKNIFTFRYIENSTEKYVYFPVYERTTGIYKMKEMGFYYALFFENGFDKKIMEEVGKGKIWLYTLEEIVNYKK